ncbi:MAG: valine dehydrogenase [Actinomycetota bacterium]|jgi:valine dehydrogenase (NAD+)|nr:valine dehydrogenase [Actinomycetota bacterium]
MGVFDRTSGHEQVVFCEDRASGLRSVIAIHSTALGPALGGTRFHPYATEAEAVDDALRLSRAMTYKAACAGLDLGGGKAVIWGNPAVDKSESLLRAYGRFVQSLGGRYYTACDVGTVVADMDVVARECDYATGGSPARGGAGDSAVLTAFGVFQGMRAAAEAVWGEPTLAGRRVGVTGAGKVGGNLVGHLVADGARVVVADVDAAATARVRATHPEVEVADVEVLPGLDLDVWSPCALGGALDDETVARLKARVVCGGANNQLAHPGITRALVDAGVVYAPDYVVNAGGVIQVGDEALGRGGYSEPRARAAASRIHQTTRTVLRLAADEGIPPSEAADRLAERRIAEVGRLRGLLVPRR